MINAVTNLAGVTDTWDKAIVNGQLPTTLDGVSVSIGGQPAYVRFVSAGQINVVAPNIGAGSVNVTVTNPDAQNKLLPSYTARGRRTSPDLTSELASPDDEIS